jgi:hypothetical protein
LRRLLRQRTWQAVRQQDGRIAQDSGAGSNANRPPSFNDNAIVFKACDNSVPFSALESAAARGADAALWADLRGNMAGMLWQFYVADDIQ